MTKESLSPDTSDDISVFIRVSPEEFDLLFSFLRSNGIKARKHWGIQNSMNLPKPEDIEKLMKSPAPYLLVCCAAQIIVAALKAYGETHKKSLKIIKSAKGGIKVEATNITPEELKQLDAFELLQFDPREDDK